MSESTPAAEEQFHDLGFGAVVANQSRQRLLNHDGSFNVVRHGLGLRASLSLYHSLLTMSWPRFLTLLASCYLLTNVLFAAGFFVLGADAVGGNGVGSEARFLDTLFLSVHTLSTIGYGHLVPNGPAANVLVMVESMVSLFGVALVAGLVFARFSRPWADVVFSEEAVIAPYEDITAFEFRIANRRKNQIIDLEAKVIFSSLERVGGRVTRRFHELPLERRKVSFFPLHWTIVHPIDPDSPMYGLTREDCVRNDAEVLVLLTGIDETFSQTVHARSSYKVDEIAWNVKFAGILDRMSDGTISIDVSRIDAVEPAAQPRGEVA